MKLKFISILETGRNSFKICQLCPAYIWNAFPDRINGFGPDFDRLATQIRASGDFSFVKFDQILLNSTKFNRTKLICEDQNLILVPPASRNFEMNSIFIDSSPNNCQHSHCQSLREDSFSSDQLENSKDSSANILIISRTNRNCSIVKKSNDISQIDFNRYSSVLIDKYYRNLWAFDPNINEFARFNLIALEISDRLDKFKQSKFFDYSSLPPNSLLSSSFTDLDNGGSKHIIYTPSPIKPNIAVPFRSHCLMRKKPDQVAIELLSLLTSLTYSQLFGLTIDDKSEHANIVGKHFSPEEYRSVCRFKDYGGGWGYPPYSVEAIRFSADCDIILGGIGLYGGRGEYNVQIRLFDIGSDNGDIEKEGDLLTETDIIHYECLPKQKYQVFFDEPLFIQANRWCLIWVSISGSNSDCGSYGQVFVCTPDQVMFHFKSSKLSNNGTDVNSGQIPILFYKLIRSNDLATPRNGTFNLQQYIKPLDPYSSSIEDERSSSTFVLSKDFMLKINASCVNFLNEILINCNEKFKNSLSSTKLEKVFDIQLNNFEKIENFLSKMHNNLNVACFSLELIRAYVQILMPITEIDRKQIDSRSTHSFNYHLIQKSLHYDYDECKKIAASLYNVCQFLKKILTNPIRVPEELDRKFSDIIQSERFDSNIDSRFRNKWMKIKKYARIYIDECYCTFTQCCHAFYPTSSLKWNLICDLLSNEDSNKILNTNDSKRSIEDSCEFSDQQTYLLSAVARAFSSSPIKLISFFPIKFCNSEKFSENIRSNCFNLFAKENEFEDIACQMIARKLTDFHHSNEIDLSRQYSCQFVYEKLLEILAKPLKLLFRQFQQTKECKSDLNQHLMDYQRFVDQQNEEELKKSTLSLTSSSTETSSISTLEGDESFETSYSKNDTFNQKAFLTKEKNLFNHSSDSDKPSNRFISSINDLLLKFISESQALASGLIQSSTKSNSKPKKFLPRNEFSTPSRFSRRSSGKCWETGCGTPEAICFWINNSDIYISGVRVYSSTTTQFKYQLQLLDYRSIFEENSDERDSDSSWRTIASASGVYTQDDQSIQNKLNDTCEIRFEKPILIHPNIKYAIVFHNYSQYSFSGDMGLAQVKGEDETVFNFMDCSLSKNGTNLNRGQIPNLLYFNQPNLDDTVDHGTETDQDSCSSDSHQSVAESNIFVMFRKSMEVAKDLIDSVIEILKLSPNLASHSNESISSCRQMNPLSISTSSSSNESKDFEILIFLFKIFTSTFFCKFLPQFMIHMKNLHFNIDLSFDLINSMSDLVALIASLNQIFDDRFETLNMKPFKKSMCSEHSTTNLIVESDHPYKPATLVNYLVKFPATVKYLTIEFDPKSSTAQPEDYLEIYIPQKNLDYFYKFNTTSNHCDRSDEIDKLLIDSIQNLKQINRKFFGKNFSNLFEVVDENQTENWKNSYAEGQEYSNCIFVPGNEIVLMLKTSSNYIQAIDAINNVDSHYGFKAEIIGHEFSVPDLLPNHLNYSSDEIISYIKKMLQIFECDLILIIGRCLDSLLNAKPNDILIDILTRKKNRHQETPKRMKNFMKYVQNDPENLVVKKIFDDNFNILHHSFDFLQPQKINSVEDFFHCHRNMHQFLKDFIELTKDSSGERLARWLQNETLLMPDFCLVEIIPEHKLNQCSRCLSIMFDSSDSSKKLCTQCYFQFFVQTIIDCQHQTIDGQIYKKIYFKIICQNQLGSIVYDPKLSIKLRIQFVSFFNRETEKILDENQSNESIESKLLCTIVKNPYQISIKDKTRFHCITMMKTFENYSLEELRMEMQDHLEKKPSTEIVSMRMFEKGLYLGRWTPASLGRYRIEVMLDGEQNPNEYFINVNDEKIDENPFDMLTIDHDSMIVNQSPIHQKTIPRNLLQQQQRFVKHSIRKYFCSDSAGLRIRALPSLQSEQIGVVFCNGLLTVIDQIENHDGTWVKLSNESIQAYCFDSVDNRFQSSKPHRDLSLSNDFFSLKSMLNEKIHNQNRLHTNYNLRTEAWALQYNKHYNRTLLVSIDPDDRIENVRNHSSSIVQNFEPLQQNQFHMEFFKSLIVPGWFKVDDCNLNDFYPIRNRPSLDDLSTIIGSVPANLLVYAVEMKMNNDGVWIRLSHESLLSNIDKSFQSIATHDCLLDGWILVRSSNNQILLRNAEEISQNSSMQGKHHYQNIDFDTKDGGRDCKKAISNRYVDLFSI